MDKTKPESIALLEEITSRDLYGKLLDQLQRDFNRANIDIEILPETGPQGLVQLLREKLHYLILEDFTSYLNLLYVIDVPESEFDRSKTTSSEEMTEKAIFLILKRVWKKVWLKEQLK